MLAGDPIENPVLVGKAENLPADDAAVLMWVARGLSGERLGAAQVTGTVEAIAEDTGIAIGRVLHALTRLEVDGLVTTIIHYELSLTAEATTLKGTS